MGKKQKKVSSLITFENLRVALKSKKIPENQAEQVFKSTKKAQAIAKVMGIRSNNFSRVHENHMIMIWKNGIKAESKRENGCSTTNNDSSELTF